MQTPKLATKQRASKLRRVEEYEQQAKENHNPQPSIGSSNNNTANTKQKQLKKKKQRKANKDKEPFMLRTEMRGNMAMEQFLRRCQEERERARQARLFKARPLPEGTAFQPAQSQKPLTEPELPPLKTEERGAFKESALSQKLRCKEEEDQALRQFQARPLPPAEPFVPAPSQKPLTEPELPPLRTEERGADKVLQLQEKLRKLEEEDKRRREFQALELYVLHCPRGPISAG